MYYDLRRNVNKTFHVVASLHNVWPADRICPTELIYMAPKLIKQMLIINLSSGVIVSRFRNTYSRRSSLYHASNSAIVTPSLRRNLLQCPNSGILC